ncbi:MAG: AMP-binding protein, partial [Paracoccaceae bacterium]
MIHKSPYPDITIPAQTIGEAVFAGLALDAPVLIDGVTGAEMTGQGLIDAAQAFAGGLAKRGIGPGDVVALMSGNSPAFAVIFHGTLWAGATLTTVNPSYTAGELRHQLNDSGARFLCVMPQMAEMAAEAVQGTKVTETLLIDDAAM